MIFIVILWNFNTFLVNFDRFDKISERSERSEWFFRRMSLSKLPPENTL